MRFMLVGGAGVAQWSWDSVSGVETLWSSNLSWGSAATVGCCSCRGLVVVHSCDRRRIVHSLPCDPLPSDRSCVGGYMMASTRCDENVANALEQCVLLRLRLATISSDRCCRSCMWDAT